jgi:hypothetical protein
VAVRPGWRRGTSPAPGIRLALGQDARRERWRLTGQDCWQTSDQAERWSLVTRPVTRLSAVFAAHALHPWAFAASQLRNPGLDDWAERM